MSEKLVIIIQARMTSTRLPGKVLMDLAGKPMLSYMLDRVKKVQSPHTLCVAITENDADDPIAQLCDNLGVTVFRGDEHDVLGRFYNAAKSLQADTIVRLTSDCPIIDPNVIDHVIALHEQEQTDYTSNINPRSYPDGLDVEVMSFATLKRAHEEAKLPQSREHVTPYIRGRFDEKPKQPFSMANLEYGADFSFVRWTVDYEEDLGRLRKLCQQLPEGFSWLQALASTTKEHAKYLELV